MNEPRQLQRFVTDHMVTKLGKYLRILGYDADWDAGLRTHELIARANAEGRVVLTRNLNLDARYPQPRRLIVLGSGDPVEQLRQVVAECGIDPRAHLFSRCIRCNRVLEEIADKEAVRAAVHPNVFSRYDTFHTCPSCHTVFWKGSHVRNTLRKLGLAEG